MTSATNTDKIDFQNTEIAFRARSTSELIRALGMFKLIGAPSLVKLGSKVLEVGFKIRLPLSPLVRWTVFKQFCGGESLEDCRKVMSDLEKMHVKAILDYGAEGEKSEQGFDSATREILKTAQEASRNSSIPFVVFKFTAIARFELLEVMSQSPEKPLSEDQKAEWQRVQNRVDQICNAALKSRSMVMIDAEETWIQPAIDREVERQMRQRNRSSAKVFTTVQLYRKDRLAYLEQLTAAARNEGWHLGVKLVRGAYMEKEREHAAAAGRESPIHETKALTDEHYDAAVAHCLNHLDQVAFCAGTHNEKSTRLASDVATALSKEAAGSKIWFSQLYGMSDHLTYNLAAAGLNAAKYVPYGPVQAVMPYLIRRAQENTAVAGQSSRELQMIERELRRRRQGM